MKSTFSFLALILIMLFSSPLLAATKVTATVSDNQVALGDIFILTVSVNDNDDDYQLDTRSLEQSFTVYRPSQSQRTEYINGEFSQQTQWQVRLQAKSLGKLTIPRLKIGDLATNPIEINVVEPSQISQSTGEEQSVFIENRIDKEQVYIGQSFIYTTKLFISKNSNELDLDPPYFEGVEASVFGKDKNAQTVRNGIRYNTITRQYKLTPSKSGQFEINSPLLTGTLRKVVAVSEWQNRVIADPINVRGDSLNINVKAIPENYQGDWIVSDDLRLIEDNDLSAQSYKVGEPITRSITLQIASIDKEKLPNIKLNYPADLRVYPDQDQLEEAQSNSGKRYAIRIMRHAIIADQAGDLTLPEIKLNWFNSRTDKAETAILPAQTLTILPAETTQSTTLPTTQPIVEQPTPTIIVDNKTLIYWQITVALLLLIILIMVLYHLSYRRKQSKRKDVSESAIVPLNEHFVTLQNSFAQNSATKCYSALLSYAQHQYPTLKSLSEFADKSALTDILKQQLKEELQWLQICCSDPTQQWQSDKLAALIKSEQESQKQTLHSDPLDINP
ncbi:protein BatD [Psychromonas sp. psych-6C06]|uniref:BatD family protein n=1 Tax=Psychromonas sp. psych-6C06 TaxID=2058089 RepID=UPI000C34343F|nr:BatD family protein [Psychromonas sp. psych-6C06]PKF63442.1 protein BatD [Psychromonas sp. psych-6C06]